MPKAQKGQRFGGRKKGSPNKKTLMWNEMGEYVVNEGAEKYMKILMELDKETYMERFEKILEYFKPKQSRVENQHEGTIQFIEKVLDKE